MRSIFIFCLLILSFGRTFAQTQCSIYYDYDPNGCRIKRYYKCIDSKAGQPQTISTFNPVLYPNPTDGVFTIGFNELLYKSTLTIYDLTRVAAGSYAVLLSAVRENNEMIRKEFTVVKN